jgi:hypothetical protein
MTLHVSDNAQAITIISGMVRTSATVFRTWVLRQTQKHPEVTDSAASIIPWDRYLRFEFPSLVSSGSFDSADSAYNSFERTFAAEVRKIQGVEEVYIRKDRDYFRVWTVLNEADVAIEDQIYDAQLRFMDQLDLPCDFTVIFRQGKDPSSVRPAGAFPLFG